jgi:hypothetical protein
LRQRFIGPPTLNSSLSLSPETWQTPPLGPCSSGSRSLSFVHASWREASIWCGRRSAQPNTPLHLPAAGFGRATEALWLAAEPPVRWAAEPSLKGARGQADSSPGMYLVHLLILLLAAIPVFLAVRVVPETQRFVVFRLGRVYGVLEPGLRWVIPGLDQVIRVDLNRAIPNWQSLSESDLQAQLRRLAQSGQLPASL